TACIFIECRESGAVHYLFDTKSLCCSLREGGFGRAKWSMQSHDRMTCHFRRDYNAQPMRVRRSRQLQLKSRNGVQFLLEGLSSGPAARFVPGYTPGGAPPPQIPVS